MKQNVQLYEKILVISSDLINIDFDFTSVKFNLGYK